MARAVATLVVLDHKVALTQASRQENIVRWDPGEMVGGEPSQP